jgi:hypothetical protein
MDRMPKRNRVDPYGELIAEHARGARFGNRGCLHDDEGRIRRFHNGRRWIYCRLVFMGRRRELLRPGRYTELFFLDVATAFAAGHRPCAECLRERFNEFRSHWPATVDAGREVSAAEIDRRLHDERIERDGSKRTFAAPVGELPDGVIVAAPGSGPMLCRDGRLRAWSFGGYGNGAPAAPGTEVEVLTPGSTVDVFAAGFVPQIAGR